MSSLASILSSQTRLHSLEAPFPLDQRLHVERWVGTEVLSDLYRWDVLALSADHNIPLNPMLGEKITVLTTLADGSHSRRSGLVSNATRLGSEGSLTRYHLTLVPWLWTLTQGFHSRVYQDKTVQAIIGEVFTRYEVYASWRFTGDANRLLDNVRPRSYCVQYRESDFDFVQRLLAEEGLGYCFIEDQQAPAGHCMVIFGDSTALPEDIISTSDTGLRYHRADALEEQDTVQFMGRVEQLGSRRVTLLSSDYKTRQAISASRSVGPEREGLESYDPVGEYAFANLSEAEHYVRLHIDALNVEKSFWQGRGTVRSARVGTRFQLLQATWANTERLRGQDTFLFTRVQSYGINNLESGAPLLDADLATRLQLDGLGPMVLAEAQRSGFGQQFNAVLYSQPWRPTLANGTGQRLNPVPTAHGPQTATVVGPDGQTCPGNGSPVHCDAMGRVRVRFHWQADDDLGACWIRVGQAFAGKGFGAQFLPRIGQEVLVHFVNGNMDRPIISKALYNGRGEGGVAPTPGGEPGESNLAVYKHAGDQHPSAEANLAGGNSPAWHGGGAGDNLHRNSAALSGFKTQGFDGNGHNQLVFDDSDQQGRVQMTTTQAHTQLNLGHLIHQAGNYRGSFRGLGFELRTDAYGSMRAAKGLLLSTYAIDPQTPAGDAVAAQALLQQQRDLAERFDLAAQIHQTVPLAAHRGVQKANQSLLIADQAPLKALQTSLNTTVTGEQIAKAAGEALQRESQHAVPHCGDVLLTLSARDSIAKIAGQSLQWTAGETLTLGSGYDTHMATGGSFRMHSGQAIGYLAGAQKTQGIGLAMIASAGAVDVQAQQGDINLSAQDELKIISINAQAQMAAGTTLHLAVDGGASLTMEGGNITFACPGTIKVHASKKSFNGPHEKFFPLPQFPRNPLPDVAAKFNLQLMDTPGPDGAATPQAPWRIVQADNASGALIAKDSILQGESNAQGKAELTDEQNQTLKTRYDQTPNQLWLVYDDQAREVVLEIDKDNWNHQLNLFNALNAMGYSDSQFQVGTENADERHATLARKDARTGNPQTLINNLKEK
ncbi:type VI secretion system Vgr family protein [Pseudomonas weihenstephanensis]|uniref:type VI secretion system Vgr family protein n=1 Tax=Pseudomonas weihenstephanensis TaxID=1608994 RepID=UPI00193C3060|nr:type VI secretion system Vgr family protein [Pseudomonas weihenstephanensis]MBM1190450.1 type VI secretion system tip protein VgrG [Pseudomonas weihenstephanensis]